MLIFSLFAVFVFVMAGVLRLQTGAGAEERAEGENQWSRSRELRAQRGTIFDRNGQELAVSVPAADISINPKMIENGDEVLGLLNEVVGLDDPTLARLQGAIAAKERSFEYVARQVPLEVGEHLQRVTSNRDLSGVNVDYVDKRILPGDETGRSVIGATDIDGVGISGLELLFGGGQAGVDRGFEDPLSGVPGRSVRAVAEDGSTIAGTERITEQPVAGTDYMLSIDRPTQFAVEQALTERVAELETKGGQVIVMDTDTGDILAMASALRDDETGEVSITSRNSAAVDAYEPGSVVKAITVSAALNEGTVTPETTFVVPWRKQYADDLLSDAAEHPDQTMSVRDILVHSSNIGTIMIKEGMSDTPEVARRTHWSYMRQFGLGETTAIGFPGESPGILKDWDDLWGSERATVSYGQGVSSTPLQLITAINTIANDGTYVAPRLVLGTVESDGAFEARPASATHEVIRPEVAEQMHEIMRAVVCDGTANAAQEGVDNYPVAGKTGTGYKAQANGTYFDDEGNRIYYSSFVGFFPADDPQITMLVSIDEPPNDTIDRFGGTAAAPVFSALVPAVAHNNGVAPSPTSAACGGTGSPE